MKIFYFEQHPQKSYLWRLNSSARAEFSDIIEHNGFCSKEYYTKELSDQMYRHIEDTVISQALNKNQTTSNTKILDMHDILLKQFFRTLAANDRINYLRIKNLFI